MHWDTSVISLTALAAPATPFWSVAKGEVVISSGAKPIKCKGTQRSTKQTNEIQRNSSEYHGTDNNTLDHKEITSSLIFSNLFIHPNVM